VNASASQRGNAIVAILPKSFRNSFNKVTNTARDDFLRACFEVNSGVSQTE